jgi:hypothetical protein
MRGSKIIVGAGISVLGLVFALVFFGPLGPGSKYHRFMAKDRTYYFEVARGCDAILKQHPVGSDGLKPRLGLPGSFILSAQDASLPLTIRALQPDTIILSSNHVYVGFGVGRLAWGIIWQQDDSRTNSWTLSTNADGLEKRLYAEAR